MCTAHESMAEELRLRLTQSADSHDSPRTTGISLTSMIRLIPIRPRIKRRSRSCESPGLIQEIQVCFRLEVLADEASLGALKSNRPAFRPPPPSGCGHKRSEPQGSCSETRLGAVTRRTMTSLNSVQILGQMDHTSAFWGSRLGRSMARSVDEPSISNAESHWTVSGHLDAALCWSGVPAGRAGGKAANEGTITLRFTWKDVGGVIEQGVSVTIPKDTDYEKAAELAVEALNKNPIISVDWTFTKVPFGTGNNTWQAQGKSKDGRQAAAQKASLRNPDVVGLPATAEVDPVKGRAEFDITGTPLALSLANTITVGIAGVLASTSDARLENGVLVAKTDDEIKMDLRDTLRSEGFSTADIDPSTHLLTVLGISLGDPAGTDGQDVGALFRTDVAGLGGFAQVTVVPEPASLLLLGTSVLTLIAVCGRRRLRALTGMRSTLVERGRRHGRSTEIVILPAVIVILAMIGDREALAGTMQPTFVVRRGPAKTDGKYIVTLEWKTKDVASKTASVTIPIPKDTKRDGAADLFVEALNKNNDLNKDWKFSAMGVPMFINAVYVIKGVAAGDSQPKMIENTIEDSGITGMAGAAGIDPIFGTATFNVTGTPLTLSLDDSITIGIAGAFASTSDARLENGVLVAKSDDEIKIDLRDTLRAEGFSTAMIDPSTHLLTVSGVSVGDPEGTSGQDLGASFETADAGLGGFARVSIVPEPASLWLLGMGAVIWFTVYTGGRRN